MIELAAFDFAGTTVQEHSAVYQALREAVEAAGARPSDADIATWMGAGKREAVAALLAPTAGGGRVQDVPAELVEVAFTDFRRRLDAAYAARPPQPFPGVEETFARLRGAGVPVALTTGFDREVTDGLLGTLGWREGVLDAVVCIDDVPAGRPAPYMIFRAMEAVGATDVAEVLVAGDTVRDLQAGTNAGAGWVVGVLTGGVSEQVLQAAPHTHVLTSVAEIPSLLDLP